MRIVIGSKTNRNSRYMGNRPVGLRYRLEIAVSNISVPKVELYTLKNTRRKDLKSPKQVAHNRYVVQRLLRNMALYIHISQVVL